MNSRGWKITAGFGPSYETEIVSASGPGGLARALEQSGDVFLVTDAKVAGLYGRWLEGALGRRPRAAVHIQADERFKTLSTAAGILSEMHSAGLTREAVLVGLGGGMVCDVAAMCASMWLRGVRLILVPTSLLCMVDACLGGKTGVNSKLAKNQIGTFYPASAVVVDTAFLETLPERELRSGLGEVLKTALISGNPRLRRLLSDFRGAIPTEAASEIVELCLRAKRDIVSADPLERGPRRILNLGHTFGHALESASGFALTHGEAVALGCIVAARMAASLEGPEALAGEVSSLAGSMGLPHEPERLVPGSLGRFLSRDKKSAGGGRRWVIPFGWGDCRQVLLEPAREVDLLSGALSADK